MLRRIFILLCSAVFGIAANAIEPPGYRIQGYQLTITPDFKTHRVSIETLIRIDNPGMLREFEFTVRKPFIVEPDKAPRSDRKIELKDEDVRVTFAKPERHMELRLRTVAEAGATSASENRPVIDDDSLFLIWSDAFYPVDWDHWAPVETVIDLPQGYEAVAPGRLLRKTPSRAGGTRFVFSSTMPQMAFSVFADRRWTRTEQDVDGFHIVTLLHPESRQFADKIFKTSPDVLRFFADLHGFMPTETFSFVTIPGMYGRRAFSGFVGYPPKALEKEMTSTGFDAHETSLLWWGYTTRASGPGAWQWSEGLGDYVEFMYDEARNLPRPPIFNHFREQYLSSDPSQEPLYSELRGNTPQKYVHGKYPWVMAALRYSIGDQAFRVGLRSLFVTYRHRTFTLDEFVSTFETASGKSLGNWRKNWFETKGIPELKVTHSKICDYSTLVPHCKVSGTIEQDGRFDGVSLDIEVANGLERLRQTIQLNDKHTEFTFPLHEYTYAVHQIVQNNTQELHEIYVFVDPGNKLIFRLK